MSFVLCRERGCMCECVNNGVSECVCKKKNSCIVKFFLHF